MTFFMKLLIIPTILTTSHITLNIIFIGAAVAFDTIIEVTNTLFNMFSTNIGL